MKEILVIEGMCTVGACCSAMFLCYHAMKQRDKIRDLRKTSKAWLEKEKKELVSEIELLRNQCLQNPLNIQLMRRRALALNKMIHLYGWELCCDEGLKMLKEAKSKLKKVLEADQDDHEAIFELGVAHFYLHKFDTTMSMSVEKEIISWKKAVKCFEQVGDKAPESYKGCNMLEICQHYLRAKAPAVEMGETNDEMDNKKHNVCFQRRHDAYKLDCEAAEIWNTINPNDVHILRRWGIALSGLSLTYTKWDTKRQEWLEEAIEKLNKALLLEPDDINTKLELAKVHLSHCSDFDGEDAIDLSMECARLDAELSALSSSSLMVLNKMGHVAAVSGESSRCFAHSQTSIFNLRSPKAIESHHKYNNPHRFFPVELPMRSGAPRLGFPAVAMQMRGLRTAQIRSCGSVAPILRLLLQQLISRK